MTGSQRKRSRPVEESSPLALATSIYRFRQRRAQIFADEDLFGEPAYDILLDLYIAHHEERHVTISDACNAAGVPCTTALRQVNILEQRGLIRRFPDHRDRRRSYVALEPRALSALERLFTRADELSRMIADLNTPPQENVCQCVRGGGHPL
jgi:DNA-binding MarR family transcriptional regulator